MLTWDEKHVKALFGLRGHPARMLQAEPWCTWLEERGGFEHVIAMLWATPFSLQQRQLLELILAHPDGSAVFYASKLRLGQRAYSTRLNDLTWAVIAQLNHWSQNYMAALHPINLPTPLTPMVGVEETIPTILGMMRRPDVRLLTLLGPGGVGKTRLAIAAGASLVETFRDGVFFIPLETLKDAALLPSRIARSLNIEANGAQSLTDAIQSYLRERQVLLILDNFEQLTSAGAFVIDLLKAADELKIMVTSREALHQSGEYRFIVPELPRPNPDNPPPLDQLEQWPAVNLFIERVQMLHPLFSANAANHEVIVRICHQLDGLPLAIELAAAQVKLLAPGQALAPLKAELKNLRDAIHWSYQLLPEPEKTLFRQLSVFGCEWSLDAAQHVCCLADAQSSLKELANKNLIHCIGNSRFQMLHAVREYGLDQLQSNAEIEMACRRHAVYYLGLVVQAEKHIGSAEQSVWMERIAQEHENLQIALQWMLDHNETEMAFTLLGAVWRFWSALSIWSETRLWMDRALTQGWHLKSIHRAKTLWGASWLAAHQNDDHKALLLAEEGLALARELGEERLAGQLLQSVADGLYRFGETERGIAAIEESLQILRPLNDREEIAWALDRLARGLWQRGEHARSREVLQESLELFRSLGQQWAIAYSLSHLGWCTLDDNDNEIAGALLTESLALFRKMCAKQRISETLRQLALLAWRRGDVEAASRMLEEGLALSRELGDRIGEGWALSLMGSFALERSDFAKAHQFFEKAQRLFSEVGEPAAIAHNLNCLKQLEMVENEN